jgi:hypothetical protein
VIYLRKFFEALSTEDPTYQDIIDNFITLSDKLGDPDIKSVKYGNSFKWIVKWSLGIDIAVFNDATIIVDKLKYIVQEFDDILAAKDRMANFNLQMKLTSNLEIHLIPKDTSGGAFKFIKTQGQYKREIRINITEIERFFNSKGINISKSYVKDEYESNETTSVIIELNKRDQQSIDEFSSMFRREFEYRTDIDIYDRIEVHGHGSTITIYPEQEKTYVTI